METVGTARVTSPQKPDARAKLAEFYNKQARRSKADDLEKRKQLQDYVAWVNTYLKRRPGVRLICDLRSFSDGVTLIQLAEIVAKDSVPGIVSLPVSLADRTANIERACDFLKEKGVNLPSDIVKDIVDSNLKAAMRVVVAIADQFLPTSVRRMQPMSRSRAATLDSSSSNASSQHGVSVLPNCVANQSSGEPPQKSPSPITHLNTTLSLGRNNHLIPFSRYQRSVTPEMRPESPIYSTPIDSIKSASEEVPESTRRPSLGRRKGRGSFNSEKQMIMLEELAQSQTEVMDMKNQMLQLFALLQRNPDSSPTAVSSTPELQNASSRDSQQSDSDASDGLVTTVATSGDQKPTSRSIDQLKEQLAQNVRGDLAKQSRVLEEEEEIHLRKELDESREQLKQLKSELLRKEYKHDTEMVDAKNVISEKEVMIMTLRHELSKHREGISKELGQLSQQLDHSRNIQGSFLTQLKEKEAEVAILRDQLQRTSSNDSATQMTNGTSEKHKRTVPEEIDSVRTCLGSLRVSLAPQDPHQHTIDQLEQAVASLVDMVMSSTSPRDPSPTNNRKYHSRGSKHRSHGLDDSGELKYVGGRQKKHGTGSGGEVSPGMASHSSPLSPDEVTRVVYYLDKDDTPYRTTIPKRCYEVTLKDFRSAIGKSSSHKFFFKSQDPDIGQVKEEVSDSSAIVPNYEGKIVGWVSEKRK